MVTPNDVVSGGNVNVPITIAVDARGAQIGAAAQIEAAMRRAVPGLAVAAVREAVSQREDCEGIAQVKHQ